MQTLDTQEQHSDSNGTNRQRSDVPDTESVDYRDRHGHLSERECRQVVEVQAAPQGIACSADPTTHIYRL